MHVHRVSYSGSDSREIRRWLEHIVEQAILSELDLTELQKLEMRVSKYFNEDEEETPET